MIQGKLLVAVQGQPGALALMAALTTPPAEDALKDVVFSVK